MKRFRTYPQNFMLFWSLIVLIILFPVKAYVQKPLPPRAKVPQSMDASLYKALPATVSSYFSQNHQVNVDADNQIAEAAPVVAAFRNHIYVVWNGDETVKSIYFSRSDDGGISFSAPVVINDAVSYPPGYSAFGPDITVDASGTIYVVWHDYRAWATDTDFGSPIEVYLDKSVDGGLTWGADIQATSGSGTYPWHFQPYLDIDRNNGHLYISFTDYDRYGDSDFGDVSFIKSEDGGATFSSKIRVDDTPEFSNAVQVFSHITVNQNNGDIHVVWQDNRNGSFDIYTTRSTNGGNSFSANVMVNTNPTNNQEEPNVAINPDNGNIYVAWKDWRDDPTPDTAPYENDIYLAHSLDGGLSYIGEIRVTDQYMNGETGFNLPPDLAIDGQGIVYVVWYDVREGYSNVYYDQSLDHGLSFGPDLQVNNDMQAISHALPRIYCEESGASYIVWMDKRNTDINGLNNWDIFLAGSAFESCPANLLLYNEIGTGLYQAGIQINANSQLPPGSDVQFKAGQQVILNPDFAIISGALFEAVIGTCD
jgi:hypothetical protein